MVREHPPGRDSTAESIRDGQSFQERQFYICSQIMSAQDALTDTQKHWGIENRLHWGGSAVGGFPDLRRLPFRFGDLFGRLSTTTRWQCTS